jgi:hypothetical protein
MRNTLPKKGGRGAALQMTAREVKGENVAETHVA